MIILIVMLIGMTLTWSFQMIWISILSLTSKNHFHRMHILHQLSLYLELGQLQI